MIDELVTLGANDGDVTFDERGNVYGVSRRTGRLVRVDRRTARTGAIAGGYGRPRAVAFGSNRAHDPGAASSLFVLDGWSVFEIDGASLTR